MTERIFDATDYQTYEFEGVPNNGQVISPIMGHGFEHGYISLVFYADASRSTLATPTQGTITFDASETGQQYGVVKAATNATEFVTESTYTRPTFSGAISSIRLTFAGNVDSGWFVCRVARYCNG